jgi:hypothetical protein
VVKTSPLGQSIADDQASLKLPRAMSPQSSDCDP